MERIPYRVLSAMPAHIQHLGGGWVSDVEVIRVGEETVLRQKINRRASTDTTSPSPREIREEFLAISSETEAVEFFRRCGRFRREVREATLAELAEWQQFFADWMLAGSKPGGFKGPQLWMPVDNIDDDENERIGGVVKWSIFAPPDSGRVEAFVDCDSALEVIGATIALDFLEGVKFEACGWCKTLFEVTKENGRQYCNPDCAHRAGQKRRRAAAKADRERAKHIETESGKRKGKA